MKKKFVFSAVIASLAIGLCAGSILFSKQLDKRQIQTGATVDPFVVGETQIASSTLTTDYQQEVTQVFNDNLVTMHYFLAKKSADNKLVLAPAGKVFNYSESATYHGRITNLTSVVINYSGGSLFIQEGIAGEGTVYEEKKPVESGVPFNFVSKPNHVMISNSAAATTITSMTFNYTCEAASYYLERFGKTYRGMASNGKAYSLERNGTNVTLGDYSGTIAADNVGGFTLTLESGNLVITGTVSSDYKTLTFTGASGAYLPYAPTITQMHRVYVLDDFENYDATGTGFGSKTNPASIFSTSGLRAQYYSDYGGGGSTTWIQNSNFSVCTSSDFLNLTSAISHSGSKAMTLKGITGSWMRFWSREVFDRNQHFNYGSGNYLSFWAHGPYTNTACTADSEKGVNIKIVAYYSKDFEITDSNRSSTSVGTGAYQVTVPAGSDWTEYSIPLDSSKKVYAINFMVDNSTLSKYQAVYIPIDDITIGTALSSKQISTSATKLTKSYHGTVTLNTPGGDMDFTVKVGLGANGYVYGYAGADMQPVNYVVSGDQVTIYTVGSFTHQVLGTYTFGNWTGTLSNSNNTLTIAKSSITGTIAEKIKSSTIVLNQDEIIADGTEGTEMLQETLQRQYWNGSAWTDYTNADGIEQNSEYYIEGSNCVYVKPYSGGNMRVIYKPDLAASESLDIESVAFWYYVPRGSRYTISVFCYKDYTPSSAEGHFMQKASKTYSGTEPGWHYMNVGFDAGYHSNFAIFVGTNSNASYLDYITCF